MQFTGAGFRVQGRRVQGIASPEHTAIPVPRAGFLQQEKTSSIVIIIVTHSDNSNNINMEATMGFRV